MISITRFSSLTASTEGQVLHLDGWAALVALLSVPLPSYQGHLKHPGWSPATFRGGHRAKADVESVSLLVVEHDQGTVAGEEAVAFARSLGLRALVLPTKSSKPAAPRWRLIFDLSRPCTVEERGALWTWAARELAGLQLQAAESRDAARFWYWPCPPAEGAHDVLQCEGEPIDVDAIVGAEDEPQSVIAPPPRPTPAPRSEGRGYLEAALLDAQRAIRGASKGERHTTVAREAYSIGGLVGGGYLSSFEASAALADAVPRSWEPSEQADARRTIAGQLQEGAKAPRTVAPATRGSAAVAFSPSSTSPESGGPRATFRVVQEGADPLAEAIAQTKGALLCAKGGAPRKVVANASTIFALDPRWSGVLAYQALSDRVVKLKAPPWHAYDAPASCEDGPWTDADTTRLQAWLSREYAVDLGGESVNAAVQAAAEKRVIDPLKDYFDALRGTWDGSKRIDIWLPAIFNAPDSPYSRAIGRRWLISAVARALRPGCKVDYVLVLEGLQGKKKSTALEKLCPQADLFFDSELQIGDKDAIQVLRGKWIIELGEVDKLSRHDLATLKAFITRKVDTYRPSFGRRPIDAARRFVFSASTNEVEYLKDPTGNRRWWPVSARGPIDIEAIERWRDQLWAEALAAFEDGDPWWLETEELEGLARAEQAEREQVDPWEEHTARWLQERLGLAEAEHGAYGSAPCPRCVRCIGVTVSAALTGAVGLSREKQDRGAETRMGTTLRALGWVKARVMRDGVRTRPYLPPEPAE